MCPWVGPHAPSSGRQLWGLPSCVEYLSPQGVLLPLVYGTTASPLWLELRGLSAWQATPSWTVYRLACHRLLPLLRVTFAMVPDAAWPDSDQWPWSTAPAPGPVGRPGRPSASDPWGVGSFLSLGRPMCARCPGPLGFCSPVCLRCLLCCVCGVLGHLALVLRYARSGWCVVCAVSRASWPPFTRVHAGYVVLRVRRPGPLGSCSPVCLFGALLCVCGGLGHLAPVHPCACSVFYFVCAVSWATWLLFVGVLAWFVHRCARSVCCVACAVSWTPLLPFTGVPAACVVLCVRCPGPLGSSSPVRPLGVLLCVRGVLGHLAPAHGCACSVRCFVCVVSWAAWLLFTSVSSQCAGLCVWCPGPPGSCSPVRPAVVSRLLVALGARACAVSWPSWCLFTSVRAVCGARVPLAVVSLFSPPLNFRFFLKFEKRGGARTLQAQARAAAAAVQSCCVLWHVLFALWRRLRPRGVARVS